MVYLSKMINEELFISKIMKEIWIKDITTTILIIKYYQNDISKRETIKICSSLKIIK
jgi:hypothetical protein